MRGSAAKRSSDHEANRDVPLHIRSTPTRGGYLMLKTVKVEATKRGLPAIWETGGGLTSGGSATIIAKSDGNKPRAVFVRTRGHLSGGPHALICVHEGFYLVYASVARGRSSARIERIVSTSVKDIDGEKWEATTEVEVINSFDRGEWDRPVDPKLEAAVETAFKKASIYHCRSAMYIDTSERQAPSAADRKKRDDAIAKQNADREAKRKAKADREAREKAEAEAASKAAKQTGLGDRLEALQLRLESLRATNPNTTYSGLKLDEAYFSLGWGQKLYTEENVAAAERSVSNWEEQSAERLRKQEAQDEFQPRFVALTSRVEALGLALRFGDEKVNWESGSYYGGFTYNQEGLEAFEADLVRKEEEAAEKAREEAAATAKASAEAEAAELGLPQDIRIWKRTGGATGCSMGWVISAHGLDRERDGLENDNPRRAARYDEGYLVWKQILPGELVLAWSKAFTAAPHEFEVVHLPSEGATEAQLERVAEIQQELQDTWVGRRGLSSGDPSPAVGIGWGLGDFTTPLPESETVYTEADEEEVEESPDLKTALERLQDKWGPRH